MPLEVNRFHVYEYLILLAIKYVLYILHFMMWCYQLPAQDSHNNIHKHSPRPCPNMSSRPCLPLPRRRKRHEEAGGGEGNSGLSGTMEISDLGQLSAMEYLGLVHGEAERMPDVFVAPPTMGKGIALHGSPHAATGGRGGDGYGGSAFAASYLLSDRTSIMPPPTPRHRPASSGDGPGGSWSDRILDDFSSLRLYLAACSEGEIGSRSGASPAFQVPPMKNSWDWHVFCLGRAEARGDQYYDDDGCTSDSTDASGCGPPAMTIYAGPHAPTASLLCQLDQVMVRRVLGHHALYLTDGGVVMTTSRAMWIYALLARLSKPLHGDDAATMGVILRECCRRRNGLRLRGAEGMEEEDAPSRETLRLLNVLIAVVGVYFQQGGGANRLLH